MNNLTRRVRLKRTTPVGTDTAVSVDLPLIYRPPRYGNWFNAVAELLFHRRG